MNHGRGFKYFLQTTTRFPETNLDLYVPRKLSTTEVNEIAIVFQHSYRSNGNEEDIVSHGSDDYDNGNEEEDSIDRFKNIFSSCVCVETEGCFETIRVFIFV